MTFRSGSLFGVTAIRGGTGAGSGVRESNCQVIKDAIIDMIESATARFVVEIEADMHALHRVSPCGRQVRLVSER